MSDFASLNGPDRIRGQRDNGDCLSSEPDKFDLECITIGVDLDDRAEIASRKATLGNIARQGNAVEFLWHCQPPQPGTAVTKRGTD